MRNTAPKTTKLRVQEIKDCQIPSFEVLASSKVDNTNVIHQIIIVDQKFKPEHLAINQGDTVEWRLCSDTRNPDDSQSLYYERSRSHVINFERVGFESPLLRISNRGAADPIKTTFRITFKEAGIFEFDCRIYTWMKGKVDVKPTLETEEPSESEEEKSHNNLVLAAIKSDKTDNKKSPIIDFKEVFEQYGEQMCPQAVINSIVEEEKMSLRTPVIEEIPIDSIQQIELEE